MKIYKYWKIEETKIQFGYQEKEISCYGGSNISEEDASAKARKKLEEVKRKIKGDCNVFDDYEVEIREEVVRVLDESSIITRNRYGAQVLNTENLMFLDIDKPKFSFWNLFRKSNSDSNKARIIKMIHKLVQKPIYCEYGFRVYETSKGIRLIVLGKKFDPKDSATRAMMFEFNCDRWYTYLCSKQDCFRARLTPKPSRIKVREPRVKFPRDHKAEIEFQQWLLEYEKASWNFSVCKFVEQIGANYYMHIPEVVQIHDEITRANQNRQLA